MTRLQFAKPLNRNGGYPRRDENISSGQATRSPLNPDCPPPRTAPRPPKSPAAAARARPRPAATLMQIIHKVRV